MAEEQIAGGGTPKPLEQFYLDIKDHVDVPNTYAEFEKVMSTGNNLQTFYDQIKADIDVPKDFNTFKSTLLPDGTNPAEKKNDGELPSDGGSSGLLSINYGGEKYDINPKTQEVSKGGKPVNLSREAKDYIAKNILGVAQPTQQTGAVGADGQVMQPIGATGAAKPSTIADKTIAEQTRRGAGGGQEIKPTLDPDIKGVLQKYNVDTDILENADPAILDQAAQDLSNYTGIKVDLKDAAVLDKAIGQAQMIRDTEEFKKLAKSAGVSEQKALDIAYDNAADKYLDSGDKELWALTKQVNQAFRSGDKATVDKLIEPWKKARQLFIDTRHDKIVSLHNMIITGKDAEGIKLGLDVIEDLKKEKNLLTKQLNGFFKDPNQVVNDMVSDTPMLSVFDKELSGKTGQQKLETIAKPMLARYFLLGKKIGNKTEGIMGEGNLRLMQTDKTYLDDVKNYMGWGDYDGEVTKNDRLEFADLHNKLGIIMPMLLINKIPIQDEEDKPVDILKKSGLSMTPALAAMNKTGQQQTNTLNDILASANISPNDLTEDALSSINTKMKKYGWSQDLAQMGGSTISIIAPMILAEAGAGFAIESLAINPRTAMVANFLLKNPIGKIAKGAGTYSLGGTITGSTELDAGTGGAAGTVNALLDILGSKYGKAARWMIATFGKQATKAVAMAAKPFAKGLGEFFEEGGETLYQAWRDTPDGKSVMNTLEQQFPDADSKLKFFVGTVVMGGGLGLASDISFSGAKKRAYDALSPENKAKADAFMGEKNQKAKDAIDEVVPVAPTPVIESNLKDVGQAKQKLQDILDTVQSDEDTTPYSIEVNGVTYEGSTPMELRADIDFLEHTENTANDELYKRNTGQTEETPPTAQGDQTNVVLAKPEAGVGVEGEVAPEQKGDIQTKQKETEAKIKRKDLFADGGTFANQLGGSGENSVPTNHREVNGIEFVEFSNPTTGIVDVVMTGTSDTDFVGYYRIYENGKPTNKWSSKFENQSRNKANFKTMISGAQQMLPQGHEYTEKTSISTDGLRVWGQQLERGYELQRDANGKLKTNRVAINGDAIENELGIPVNKGNFDNISVTNNADMKKVKSALLPYLQKFGLDENNIHFENGTVEIDLPVLKQTTTTQAAPTTTPSPINTANAPETVQNAQENGQNVVTETTNENLPQGGEVKETITEKQVPETTSLEEGNISSPEEYDQIEKHVKEEEKRTGVEYPNLSYKEAIIHQNIGKVDAQQLKAAVGEKVFNDDKMALRYTKKGAQKIDQRAQELSEIAGVEITPQDIFDYFLDRTANSGKYVKSKAQNYKAAEKIGNAKQNLLDNGFQYAANATENVDELLNPDFIESLRGFPLTDEETDAILETIKKTDTDENFKNGLRKQLSDLISVEKTRSNIVSGKGESETATPSEKVNEQTPTESQGATETNLGTKESKAEEQAIPKEKIDNLIKGGTKRKAALESITEPKMAEVAKILTDTKGIDKVMGILNNDDPLLFDLQEKLGFKKIC